MKDVISQQRQAWILTNFEMYQAYIMFALSAQCSVLLVLSTTLISAS